MIQDSHHVFRRCHAITRLFERYGISISTTEYEIIAKQAQSAAQYKGTNIVKLMVNGRDAFATIRRGEISTFLTPEQAETSIHYGRLNTGPRTQAGMSFNAFEAVLQKFYKNAPNNG